MQGLRGRKDQDDRVTISQVLIESRNLSDRDDSGVGGGGSCTGISGTGGVGGFDLPDNTNYFADTIALSGASGVGVVYTSPADDTGIATLEVPICGPFSFAEIQFILNGSATSANALVKTF